MWTIWCEWSNFLRHQQSKLPWSTWWSATRRLHGALWLDWLKKICHPWWRRRKSTSFEKGTLCLPKAHLPFYGFCKITKKRTKNINCANLEVRFDLWQLQICEPVDNKAANSMCAPFLCSFPGIIFLAWELVCLSPYLVGYFYEQNYLTRTFSWI